MKQLNSISITRLKQLLDRNKDFTVLDVRSEAEYLERHIPFAVNLPVEQIEAGKTKMDLRNTIVTVCGKGGGRSERAAMFIREHSNSEVFFLEGGTLAWFENEPQA